MLSVERLEFTHNSLLRVYKQKVMKFHLPAPSCSAVGDLWPACCSWCTMLAMLLFRSPGTGFEVRIAGCNIKIMGNLR